MTELGICIRAGDAGVATLVRIALAAPHLVDVPWLTFAGDGHSVIVCPSASDNDLQDLPIVRKVGPGRFSGDGQDYLTKDDGRHCPHLLQTIEPRRSKGDPVCQEAIFVAEQKSAAAARLVERLLLLGCTAVRSATFHEDDSDYAVFFVAEPSLYLLMRARDEDEGVRAYAASAPRVFTAWGFHHPAAHLYTSISEESNCLSFIERDGSWWTLPDDLPQRPIFSVLAPSFASTPRSHQVSDGTFRFAVELKLSASERADPELFLLSQEQFVALEEFIETTASTELQNITVARLSAGPDIRYLVRERARANVRRVAHQIAAATGAQGYRRAQKTDDLYVPAGQRLTPSLPPAQLRTLFQLGAGSLTIVEQDRDGPLCHRIENFREQPLSDWIDLVVTDRRHLLDGVMERALFSFPTLATARREREERQVTKVKKRKRSVQPVVVGPTPVRPTKPEPNAQRPDGTSGLREQMQPLQDAIAKGGERDAGIWARLAKLKLEAGEGAEACFCADAAQFFNPKSIDSSLAAAHRDPEKHGLSELVMGDTDTSTELMRLASAVMLAVARGDGLEGFEADILEIFSEPSAPVGRRLAWSVVRAITDATGDRLGLTRAKESILGGMNKAGLSQQHDLPRFVRFALALHDKDNTKEERLDQLEALQTLWQPFEATNTAFDVMSNYRRLIFATGFVRLGANERASALVEVVHQEAPAHDAANAALFALYLARMSIASDDTDIWQSERSRIIDDVGDTKTKRAVIWFSKRSLWLKGDQSAARIPWIRPKILRQLEEAQSDDALLAARLHDIIKTRRIYDYEIVEAIDQCLSHAMASGNETLIDSVSSVVTNGLERIGILGHRARAIGLCISARAALGQENRVRHLLDSIVDIALAPLAPSVRELLQAVRPALLALRRFGARGEGEVFLRELRGSLDADASDSIPLVAAVAEGLLQFGHYQEATALLTSAVDQCLLPKVDYVARDQAAAAILSAGSHWPLSARSERAARLLDNIDAFGDTFTVRTWFPTFQLLLMERIVDTLVDHETFSNDRIQIFLDREEFALRRTIGSDWNQRCGQ